MKHIWLILPNAGYAGLNHCSHDMLQAESILRRRA